MFEFHDPGRLVDEDLVLVLEEEYPGDPATNYVPAYKFQMTLAGEQATESSSNSIHFRCCIHPVMRLFNMARGVIYWLIASGS